VSALFFPLKEVRERVEQNADLRPREARRRGRRMVEKGEEKRKIA
jgi:hypothetical protein